MTKLTLDELQRACVMRDKSYRNARGELNDCADWSPADWLNALIGEIGEACNMLKKVRRGDMLLRDARPHIAKEFGDAQTYLAKWASSVGIDLGQATFDKFNEVSYKVGSPVTLPLPVMRGQAADYSMPTNEPHIFTCPKCRENYDASRDGKCPCTYRTAARQWPAGALSTNACTYPDCNCGGRVEAGDCGKCSRR